MNTTKCQTCGSTSQVWAAVRQPVQIVSECDHCKGRSAKGSMTWTLEAHATRTQFAPNKISR
jgi:NAD-dependent SIR2 family protein deacetylase